MTLLEMTVDGDPIPKARPRVGRGRAYTPKRTLAASDWLTLNARALLRATPPTRSPVQITVDFYVATARRVDVDNLLKLVLDALNGVVWVDDNQVVAVTTTKQIDRQRPRTHIRVTEIQASTAA